MDQPPEQETFGTMVDQPPDQETIDNSISDQISESELDISFMITADSIQQQEQNGAQQQSITNDHLYDKFALHLRDPSLTEIAEICKTEISAVMFCKSNGLLPDIPVVGCLGNRPRCTFSANCVGELYQIFSKSQTPLARCTGCKRKRSLKLGNIILGRPGGRGSWFSKVDSANRPTAKLQIRTILLIVYCWSLKLSLSRIHVLLGNMIGESSNTIMEWCGFIRALLKEKMSATLPAQAIRDMVDKIDKDKISKNRHHLLENTAAELWWRRSHRKTPFWDFLDEIKQAYPMQRETFEYKPNEFYA